MKYLLIYLCVVCVALFLGIGVVRYRMAVQSKPNFIKIHGATFRVEIADTTQTITRGLSGAPPLALDQGMLFVFDSSAPRSFWMKEMNFPLDMIWINGDEVIGVTQDIPAPSPQTPLSELPLYSSPGLASRVLEVNAGTADRIGITVGDKVE